MVDELHNQENWPPLLRSLAGLIGAELTLRLVDEHGGRTKIYIPHDPSRAHPWREVLGEEPWAKVVQAYGGEYLYLASRTRVTLKKEQIHALCEDGLTFLEIAHRLRVSERYVRHVANSIGRSNPRHVRRDDPRQRKLF